MRTFFLPLLVIAVLAADVHAGLAPHDATNDVACESCHTSHQSLGSRGYDNMCLSCHKAGSPSSARKFGFAPGDAANPFRTYTSSPPPSMAQTSHTWVGKDYVPAAGALPPSTAAMKKQSINGYLSCVKCHNVHSPRVSATNSAPFLRMLNDRDQMCLDCHRPRNTRDQNKGTHPVNFSYTTATLVKGKPAEFRPLPVNSNPANATSEMKLKGGAVLCSTCHGVHFADSNSATFDSRTSTLSPSPAGTGGHLLRASLRGATATATNLCTSCHIKPSHNKRGQNIQCGDCHGGHVDDADGTTPNVYVVRRYMNISTAQGAVRNSKAFLQSTSVKNWRSADAAKPGVCEACHEVPTGGSYPPEHTSTNGKVCMGCHVHNSASGAFSASCDLCHGFPPRQNTAGGTNGYAGTYFALSGVSEATSPHLTHAGGSPDYSFGCNDCHKGNNHGDANYQDVFRSTAGTLAATAGAVPTYNPATRQCSSTYCHSNGAPRGGALVTTAVSWPNGRGTITDCSACHAAMPGTNAHTKHIFKGYTCYQCHAATVDKDAFTTIANKANHVNAVKNVAFSNTSTSQGGTYNDVSSGCANFYCHSRGTATAAPYAAPRTAPTWTGSLTCTGCHGDAGTGDLSGVHASHVNNPAILGTNNSFGCVQCHAKTVSNDTTISGSANHVNRMKDYSGAKAGRNVSCMNFYCHSNGNPGTYVYANPPAWNSGANLGCSGCHGTSNTGTGAPDYASGGAATTTANSHDKHVAGAGITDTTGCANCHARTVDAAVAGKLRNYSTLHLNKGVDVAFKLIGGKTGSYDGSTTRCSNTYCHGTAASPQWGLTAGVPLACNTCHSASATGSGWSAASAHKLHWEDATLPTSYTLTPGNTSSDPTKYRFACSSCHKPGSSLAVHAAGPESGIAAGEVFFGYTATGRSGSYSYGGSTTGTDNGFGWTSGTNCTTTYCHSDGKGGNGATAVNWGATAGTGCTACHGNAAANTLSGAHAKHVNNAGTLGTNFKCYDCHAKTVGVASDTAISDKRNHVNKFREYSGSRAGRSATCANFYCHSNGKGTYANPPAWLSGSTLDCKGCHGTPGGAFASRGGEPNYASGAAGSLTANSHALHVGGAADCVKCHQKTTADGTSIRSGVTTHIDRTYNVSLSKVSGFTTYSGTYNSATKTCFATYCHGGSQNSPVWGTVGPLSCETCHKASNALPAGHTIHFADATPFTSYTATPGNRSTAGAYRFACSSCHGKSISNHAGGPVAVNSAANVFFAFSSPGRRPAWNPGGTNSTDEQGFAYTAGSAGTCNGTYCHSNGQGGNGTYGTLAWNTAAGTIGCTGCHGDAASNNLSARHAKHVNNAAVLGTNNSFGCVECHAKTVSSNIAIANKANHVNKFKDFSGARAGHSYNAATKECANVYCHSNGNRQALVYVSMTGSKVWSGSTTLGCNGCHGRSNPTTGAPDYVSAGAGSATANSHDRHVAGAGITATTGCVTCHARTVSATTVNALRNYSTLHLDGDADVAFKQIGGKTGSYDAGTARCSATYCHGTNPSPQWGLTVGTPLACNTCHSARANDSGWSGASAHKLHWEDGTLPTSFTMTPGNGGTAGAYRFACSSCHQPGSTTTVHAAGLANANAAAQVYFGFTSATKKGTYGYDVATFANDNGFPWTAGGAAGCNTTYCHSDGNGTNSVNTFIWSAAANSATSNVRCKKCHGYTNASGTAIATGTHTKHISSATYGIGCVKCHAATTDGSTITDKTKHVNKVKNVAWDVMNSDGSGYNSGCTNIYCHSSGTKNTAPYVSPNMAATWGGSLGTNCAGCHKGDKVSGDPMNSASHAMHVASYGMNCVKCHATTATTTRSIGTPSNHVNKIVNVAFNNSTTAILATATYNGSVTPMSKTPGSAYGQCTNTYCHSTVQGANGVGAPTAYGTPTWGASMSCSTCHRGPVNHFGRAADGTLGLDLDTGSHGKHLSYTFNFTSDSSKCTACHKWDPAAPFNDCNQCHNSRFAKHVNGQIDVVFDSAFGSGTYNGTVKPGDGYSTCGNVYCHSDGKATPSMYATPTWGNPASAACGTCHGANATSPPATTPHVKHVGSASPYRFACAECHSLTVKHTATSATFAAITSTTYHVNKAREVAFDATNTFGNYSAVMQGCRSVYCHSTGNLNVAAANLPATYNGSKYARPNWSGSMACNSCHGRSTSNGMPDYTNSGAAGSATSNSHAKHVTSSNIGCVECHEKTTKTNTSIRPTSPSYHANGVRSNVFFNLSGTSSSGTYDSSLKKCSNTYCHGAGASLAWGGSTYCNSCHSAGTAGSGGGGVNNWASVSAHKLHIEDTTVLPSKFTNYSAGNLSVSTTTYRFACASCHNPSQAVHVSGFASGSHRGQVFFGYTSPGRKPTYAYTGGAGSADNGFAWSNGNAVCNQTYCHSNGNGGNGTTAVSWATTANTAGANRCGLCHNKAGDASWSGSAAHTKHMITYAGNANFTCSSCHALTASDNSTLSDKTKHVNKVKNVSTNNWAKGTWDASTKTCANTYCHGNGTSVSTGVNSTSTVAWTATGTITCSSCHASGPGSTTPREFPATASGTSWTNPTNVYAVDGSSAVFNTTTQNYLIATNYGYTTTDIPDGTTIRAIQVVVKGNGTSATAAQRQIQVALTKNGSAVIGTAKTAIQLNQTTDTQLILGSAGDLWGTTWTPAELRATTFGVMIRDNDTTAAAINIDSIWVVVYTNSGAKNNSHASHAGVTCDVCHNATTTTGTTITNPANHVNGVYNLQAKSGTNFTYTYVAASAGGASSCATITCHSDATWGVSVLDCTMCHSVAVTKAAGGTRRAITPEFANTWSHKRSAGGAVTKFDCCVCHLEGNTATGKATSYHGNGTLELRDPDTGGQIVNFSGSAVAFTRFTTSFTTGAARFTAGATANTIDNVIQQKFCLKCHDADGAANSSSWVPGGQALKPFNTAITGGTPATAYDRAGVAGAVYNVYTSFSPGNSSSHPVRGPRTNSYCNTNTMNAPYAATKTAGTKSNGYVITCWDCHNDTATLLTTKTVTAHGYSVTLRGTIWAASPGLCLACHKSAIYTATTQVHAAGSAFVTPSNSSMKPGTDLQTCNNCHFSAISSPGRPRRGEDIHGFNRLATGGNWPNYGNRPYAFIRNTVQFKNHRPKTSPENAAGSAGCNLGGTGSTCSHVNMPTTAGSTAATYTPGGVY